MPGGISAFGHEVLGLGWLGGDGMTMGDVVHELAQQALQQTFEQLERIGKAGAEGLRYHYLPAPQQTTRESADRLLTIAERAIGYARTQLHYMAPTVPVLAEVTGLRERPWEDDVAAT